MEASNETYLPLFNAEIVDDPKEPIKIFTADGTLYMTINAAYEKRKVAWSPDGRKIAVFNNFCKQSLEVTDLETKKMIFRIFPDNLVEVPGERFRIPELYTDFTFLDNTRLILLNNGGDALIYDVNTNFNLKKVLLINGLYDFKPFGERKWQRRVNVINYVNDGITITNTPFLEIFLDDGAVYGKKGDFVEKLDIYKKMIIFTNIKK